MAKVSSPRVLSSNLQILLYKWDQSWAKLNLIYLEIEGVANDLQICMSQGVQKLITKSTITKNLKSKFHKSFKSGILIYKHLFNLKKIYKFSMSSKREVKVYINKCHLKLYPDSKFVACLKIDQEYSEMTAQKMAINGVINFNEVLKMNIDNSLINDSCKFNIIIYTKKDQQSNPQIKGKATLRYEDAHQSRDQIQYEKFKIQLVHDHNAYIEACLVIDHPQQTKKDLRLRTGIQNSPLKRTLNSSRQLGLRSPMASCYKCSEKDRQIQNLRTELLAAQGNNGKLIASLKQDNNVLKQILKIEQKKNATSSKFVAQVMKILGMPVGSQGLNGLTSINIISQLQHRQQLSQSIKKSPINQSQYHKLQLEKQEFSQLSEQLSNEIIALKEHLLSQKRKYESKIQELIRKYQKNEEGAQKTKYANQISNAKQISNSPKLSNNPNTFGRIDLKKISNVLQASISERKSGINTLQNCQKRKIQPKIFKDILSKLNEELEKSYAQILKKRLTKETILSHKQEVRKLLQTHIF